MEPPTPEEPLDSETITLKLQEELDAANKRINELTALIYRITKHFETRHFNYSMSHMEDQNMVRMIHSKIVMTPEIFDIVNKSMEQPTENL